MGGCFATVHNHRCVVGAITLQGTHFDTLLSEGTFGKTRAEQMAYAASLGYRLATMEEHLAYVEGLLAKENNGMINEAEKAALATHRERHLRNSEGRIEVCRRQILTLGTGWDRFNFSGFGALFVRLAVASH